MELQQLHLRQKQLAQNQETLGLRILALEDQAKLPQSMPTSQQADELLRRLQGLEKLLMKSKNVSD